MKFEIEPYKRVGAIEFGMSREEARRIFSTEPKVVYDLELRDIFTEIGVQIFYKYEPPHLCQAIMLEKPAEVSILSYNLLSGNSIARLKNLFEISGFNVSAYTEGVEVNELGVFLSTQDYELFGDEPPESVVAFIEGYYSHKGNRAGS
jgi:hypothetical protein